MIEEMKERKWKGKTLMMIWGKKRNKVKSHFLSLFITKNQNLTNFDKRFDELSKNSRIGKILNGKQQYRKKN